jgi:hypothetical protein
MSSSLLLNLKESHINMLSSQWRLEKARGFSRIDLNCHLPRQPNLARMSPQIIWATILGVTSIQSLLIQRSRHHQQKNRFQKSQFSLQKQRNQSPTCQHYNQYLCPQKKIYKPKFCRWKCKRFCLKTQLEEFYCCRLLTCALNCNRDLLICINKAISVRFKRLQK